MLYYRVMLVIVLLMYAMWLDYDHKQVEKRVSLIIQNADSGAKERARIREYYKKYNSSHYTFYNNVYYNGWRTSVGKKDTVIVNYDSTYGDGWDQNGYLFKDGKVVRKFERHVRYY